MISGCSKYTLPREILIVIPQNSHARVRHLDIPDHEVFNIKDSLSQTIRGIVFRKKVATKSVNAILRFVGDAWASTLTMLASPASDCLAACSNMRYFKT